MRSLYHSMPLSLSTARLTLQHWGESDAGWYRELLRERGGSVPSRNEAREQLAGIAQRDLRTGLALLTVRRRLEGDMVGYCGLVVGRSTVEEPELAWELLALAKGQGYVTEAGAAVVGAASQTGRERLWATVRTWNTASFRVLDRLDFRRRHSTIDDQGELVWLSREL